MNYLRRAIEGITRWGVALGGVVLTLSMLIMVLYIAGRKFNFAIPGSYELFELLMAVPVGFALILTALNKGHVAVHLLTSRFPPKLEAAADVVMSLLCFIIWALIAWVSGGLAFEKGLREVSETIEIPYMPFRLIWAACLIVFSLIYLMDACRAAGRLVNK